MKKVVKTVLVGAVVVAAVTGVILGLNSLRGRSGTGAKVIATNFVGYDLARAVLGSDTEVRMLLKPGTEMHDFEPTPQDVVEMGQADLVIYNGGESEEWVERLLEGGEVKAERTLRMMDLVRLKEEEVVEGMEEEGGGEHAEAEGGQGHGHDEVEYDEHIWTSPVNMVKMAEGVRDRLVQLWPERREKLTVNTEKYVAQLKEVDQEIAEVVAGAKRKELIFGDRFPFRYLVDEYGLSYFAAFPGCAEQTEASSKTVAFLVDKVKADKVPVVLKIELTSGMLAETIAREAGAKVLTLNAAHNIAQEDFEAGVTYIDLMRKNVAVLREALN